MSSCVIRSAITSDCANIYKIIVDNVEGVISRNYSSSFVEQTLQSLSVEKIQEYLNEENRKLFVAARCDEILGTASLCGSGEVRMVFVHQNEQGNGIGRALMQRIEYVAKMNGIIQLHLSSSKNAVGFYERLGFKKEIEKVECDSFIPMTKKIPACNSFEQHVINTINRYNGKISYLKGHLLTENDLQKKVFRVAFSDLNFSSATVYFPMKNSLQAFKSASHVLLQVNRDGSFVLEDDQFGAKKLMQAYENDGNWITLEEATAIYSERAQMTKNSLSHVEETSQ